MHYKGFVDGLKSKVIDLNIKYLEKGHYQLRIIHDRKVIKTIHFEH